ncbi:hypothetical protein HQN90_05235 [Paenibacillus alba]|uniref:hypothetical protein n=1 Tax=Paenibacillus alba TaxID=1197127 RepID=UPI0015674328|nr:hypothetical protein [Paenibacillus alba]NQX65526.1 hypothetical protein [Paenibacillus alba]
MYDQSILSKIIGFHRKHQRIPVMEEVEKAYESAIHGDIDGAIRILDWKRHCFYVKNNDQREIMSKIFEYASIIIK